MVHVPHNRTSTKTGCSSIVTTFNSNPQSPSSISYFHTFPKCSQPSVVTRSCVYQVYSLTAKCRLQTSKMLLDFTVNNLTPVVSKVPIASNSSNLYMSDLCHFSPFSTLLPSYQSQGLPGYLNTIILGFPQQLPTEFFSARSAIMAAITPIIAKT